MTGTKPKETGLERRRRSGGMADADCGTPPRGPGNAAGASGKRRKGLRETLQGLSPMAGPLITLQGPMKPQSQRRVSIPPPL